MSPSASAKIVLFEELVCSSIASGTRKACAISAVVKPPTARSVRAIADDVVRAGWQHIYMRMSVSSSPESLAGVRRRDDVAGLHGGRSLTFPASHITANLVGHPPGCHVREPGTRVVRHTLARPLCGSGHECLLNRVFGSREISVSAKNCSEHLRCKFSQQVLEAVFRHATASAPYTSGGPLMI